MLLPEPDGPIDRGELALLEVNSHPVQGPHLVVAEAVDLARLDRAGGGHLSRRVSHTLDATSWRTRMHPPLGGDVSDLGVIVGTRHDETALVGHHHRLHAIAEIELGEHPTDMGLDRRLSQVQLLRDLRIRQAASPCAEVLPAPVR